MGKFFNDHSARCTACGTYLTSMGLARNDQHLYPIGQLYGCACGASKVWTNSIRNEKALLAHYATGKDYYQGFCNDLYDSEGRQIVPWRSVKFPGEYAPGQIYGTYEGYKLFKAGQGPDSTLVVWPERFSPAVEGSQELIDEYEKYADTIRQLLAQEVKTNPEDDYDDNRAYMLYANPAEDDFSGAEEHSDERIRDLIEGPYPFNLIPTGERVEAHLNLGTKMRVFGLKTWSLRWKRREKRVYGHAASVVLQDVKFRVGQAGAALAARSKEGGKKTVHAFADGILVDSAPPHEGAGDNPPPGSVRIRYNPHPPDFHKRFMRMDPETGAWDIPVARCATLWLTSDWKLFAVGVVDL